MKFPYARRVIAIIIEPVRKTWLPYAELPKTDAKFMAEDLSCYENRNSACRQRSKTHFSKVPNLKLNNWVNPTN